MPEARIEIDGVPARNASGPPSGSLSASPDGFEFDDVGYGVAGGTELVARLYRPHGPGPFPAVVSVHGGGWVSGNRLMDAQLNEVLAAHGIVVMAVDFRLPPLGAYPRSVADVNLAVRWLKAWAAEEPCASGRVGGIGMSSGAHQLLLSALRPFDERYASLSLGEPPRLPVPVDATLPFVVACWPVVDPARRLRMARARGRDDLVDAHAAYWPDEQAMLEGNPQLILERGEAVELPALLVVQGTADSNVPHDMAERFIAAYRLCGGEATLRRYAGQPHGFIAKRARSAQSLRALREIVQFIKANAALGEDDDRSANGRAQGGPP